jgi:hypothetical protein
VPQGPAADLHAAALDAAELLDIVAVGWPAVLLLLVQPKRQQHQVLEEPTSATTTAWSINPLEAGRKRKRQPHAADPSDVIYTQPMQS